MPAIHSTSCAVARWLVASLCAITSAMAQVNAADRSVTVKGTCSAQGLVLVALHDSAEASLKPGKHAAAEIATADPQGVTVVFRNLPAGRDALTAFHDESTNGKLDFNLTGAPVEALGFSNDVFGTAAAPGFAQAAADPWLADFQGAAVTQPWTLGCRTPAGDFAGASAQVSGRFPPAVQGVLFRNGPATRGMVQRCAITATGATHRGKVARAPTFVAEQAAGHERALEPYDSAAVEREAARTRPLDAAAESSALPCARRSWRATLPTLQRCTRRWPHSTSRA